MLFKRQGVKTLPFCLAKSKIRIYENKNYHYF